MKLARVVVSGAHGFIGSHLIDHLRHLLGSKNVMGLTRRDCDFSKPQDIAQILKRLRPAVFFHAAGGSRGSFEEMVEGNIVTTLRLFQAVKMSRRDMRIVILGSAAEYGETKERCAATKTPLRPSTPYAWTKACQSQLAAQASGAGLNVVVARLFNFTGPGLPSRFEVGAFAEQIVKAERGGPARMTVGNLSSRRDFLDIRDAVHAIVRTAEQGISGRVYDVCSGASHSMREILKALLSESKQAIQIRSRLPKSRTHDISRSVGDPSAIKRLGWQPMIPLKQSLQDTMNDYRRLV